MKKIINTFKYGSVEAKRVLIFAILSGAVAVGLLFGAIFAQNLLLFFGMIISVFVTISFVQTLEIREEKPQELPQQAAVLPQKVQAEQADVFAQETENSPENDVGQDMQCRPWIQKKIYELAHNRARKKVAKMKKQNKKKKQNKQAAASKKNQSVQSQPMAQKGKTSKRTQAMTGGQSKPQKPSSQAGQVKQKAGQPKQKKSAQQAPPPEELEIPAVEAATEEEFAAYDKKKVKKLFHKYKVKRDHRLAMIDSCKALNISQTPAYIWVADNAFHMLLIEKEPRYMTLPIFKIQSIKYLKKQPVNEDVDYAAFKSSNMLTNLFRDYLPDYSHSTVVDDLTAYKNLYGIGPDIYFTNRSAGNLMDLLGVEFQVDDKVTMSNKVNVYFKDAYKSNILLRDSVIDANGYADRISNTLNAMANSAISYAEFKDTLNLMQKNKLITSEFAMYYMGVRDKKNN